MAKFYGGAENAIEKIHEFDKFGSILGLERMNELLELLGNPQDRLKVIHVAGTNGKGSVCKYIYSVLREEGYSTGLYTSPFLELFNERIELDDKYISDEDLAEYTDRVLKCVKNMTDAGKQSPTEFEVVTAIACLYFAEKKCDYVVLEVGLGGKGDSTNVCKSPLISVITSIAFDHMDRLGNTLAEIAGEKAGIIKDGCPVVTGTEDDEALQVIEDVAEAHKSMYFETRHIPYTIKSETLGSCVFNTDIQGVMFENVEISMNGEHQVKNAVTALSALCIMEENGDVSLKRDSIYKGMKKAIQMGRFEVMSTAKKEPVVIIDGAHNPDGAKALRNTIERLCGDKKVLMVTGMLADKDTDNILKEFTAITEDFIATEPNNPRKMDCSSLKEKVEALGASCIACVNPKDACALAIKKSLEYDVILFAGSLYLIGEIRGILRGYKGEQRI